MTDAGLSRTAAQPAADGLPAPQPTPDATMSAPSAEDAHAASRHVELPAPADDPESVTAPAASREPNAAAPRSAARAATSVPAAEPAPSAGGFESATEPATCGSSPSPAPARRVELLAPAGGPEAFAAALAAGADAIYIGLGAFNARRKAENFTIDELERACRTAHLAGARVYVTMNIVIKDEEMPQALDLVARAARAGTDAFIIQDWGLLTEVHRLMPELELHVSTQANIADARAAAWCGRAGARRVTLARELSLPEIAEAARTGVELEVFAHGSLCFCYSGLCMLSVFTRGGTGGAGTTPAGRSANRGMCAQPCRLPYELVDERGHVLSAPGRERALCPRDNCTIGLLPQLLDAGVTSLKLEGRMKAPDYVHSVTSVYREQLDDLEAGRVPTPDEEQERARRLKRCFNRDFTTEYLHGRSDDAMMSYERSNNRGQVVGQVVGSRPVGGTAGLRPTDRRVRAAIVRIRLSEPVGAGDLLELRHDDEWDQFLTVIAREEAPAGFVIECRAARAMPAGATVRLIRSQAALDASESALKREIPRARPVAVRIRARLGEPFAVTLTCMDAPALAATAEGPVVEPARTKAVTRDELVEHVGRMGATPFAPTTFAVELDPGCGMGFSTVHKVRAAACEALEEKILAPYAERAGRLAQLPPFESTGDRTPDADAESGEAADTGEDGTTAAGSETDSGTAAVAAGVADAPKVAAGVADAPKVAAGVADAPKGAKGETPVEAAPEGEAPHKAVRASATGPAADRHATEICALATSPEAARAALEAGAARIYLAADALDEAGIAPAEAAAQGLVPVLDEVCREADHARLDRWARPGAPVAVGNISELALAEENDAVAEVCSCLPVHNRACLEALATHGARVFWLSPELTLAEIGRLEPAAKASGATLGIMVAGRPRVMTSEHCILQVADACVHDCARCGLRARELELRNIDGRHLPVRTDAHGRSRLYAPSPLDLTPELPKLMAAGVTRFLVDGTLMEPAELGRTVARAVRALRAACEGRAPAPRQRGATAGLLYQGVA